MEMRPRLRNSIWRWAWRGRVTNSWMSRIAKSDRRMEDLTSPLSGAWFCGSLPGTESAGLRYTAPAGRERGRLKPPRRKGEAYLAPTLRKVNTRFAPALRGEKEGG